MFLSYDCALLALFGCALSEQEPELELQSCVLHPVNKRPTLLTSAPLAFAADVNVLLSYNKLCDDWKDERNIISNAASKTLLRAYKRAKRARPQLSAVIESHMRELISKERARCASMDEVADVFARMLQGVFALMNADDSQRRQLNWFAYNLGKWLYLIDAYDDREKDVKQGAYNVLTLQFADDEVQLDEAVMFNLTASLEQAAKAYELLNIKRYKSLIDNIVYLGLMDRTKRVLEGEEMQLDGSL